MTRLTRAVEQRLFDALVDQDVVRGHTGLAGVQELAPRQPAGGDLDVSRVVDDGRVFASELERDRGQVARPRRPLPGARPVPLPVKKMWSQRCSRRAAATVGATLGNGDSPLVKVRRQELGQ